MKKRSDRRRGASAELRAKIIGLGERSARKNYYFELQQQLAERLRVEEAMREADRRKDEFLAILGHELRNPLTPIRNAVHILRRSGPLNSEQMRASDLIERQSQHLSRLVDDLLDISRITRGRIQLRRVPLDLGDLVLAAVDDHRAAFESSRLMLSLIRAGEPLPLHGDPVRLTQVVDNLLGNARKFTEAGGRVSVEVGPNPDGTARVVVTDTGMGIAPEMLPTLFQPFMQSDRNLARNYGGLGIGLSLARGIVELHGGTIQAASQGVGRGARFEVRLPLRHELKTAPDDRQVVPAPLSTKQRRILVVDDDLDAAETIRLLLEQAGHLVMEAHNGESGVAAAERFHPEVVLCDIGLPGSMDGHQVARALRQHPELRSVHLIALTGYGGPEDRRRALEAGFDSHVTKPADPETLYGLVNAAPAG